MIYHIFFIQKYNLLGDKMKFIKNSLFSIIFIIISLIVLTFILTLFSYFNIFNDKTVSIFKIIIPIISLLIGGYYIGKNSNEKGWLEGLKLSIVFIILLIIFNLIFFKQGINIKNILYYIIMTISTIFGSMIGISMKKNDK